MFYDHSHFHCAAIMNTIHATSQSRIRIQDHIIDFLDALFMQVGESNDQAQSQSTGYKEQSTFFCLWLGCGIA